MGKLMAKFVMNMMQRRPSVGRLTLVTEEASPAGITVALPGLLAGAMLAPGVRDALVTQAPLPTHAAPATVSNRLNLMLHEWNTCRTYYQFRKLQGMYWETLSVVFPSPVWQYNRHGCGQYGWKTPIFTFHHILVLLVGVQWLCQSLPGCI